MENDSFIAKMEYANDEDKLGFIRKVYGILAA